MNIEQIIVKHYERKGQKLSVSEILRKGADDMHIGGCKASAHLMGQLKLKPEMRVLDIGSGVGGPARFAAENYGVYVTGVDLTPEYKALAEELSAAAGVDSGVKFETGSALSMKFGDDEFDAAYSIHVGMNIEDKRAFYNETSRVLKSGASFGIYDVMMDSGDGLVFPLPWADTKDTSFLKTPNEIQELLTVCGFEVLHAESRRDFALEALKKMLGKDMAENFRERVNNLYSNVGNNICAPWEIVCRSS